MPCYMKDTPSGRLFACSEVVSERCADCSWFADFACDYPVGDGKTCDRLICGDHAREVAPGVHYCPGHLQEWEAFVASGGVRQVLENIVPFKPVG